MAFGVLALQGDFEAHLRALRAVGVVAREVRRVAQLDGLRGLVLPGGESTTLLRLMEDEPWFDALRAFHARGGALFGTCAGAILLASEVVPRQRSLGLLDATIERNAYGRQRDSFEEEVDVPTAGGRLRAAFIRAPRFVATGPKAEVLATRGPHHEPVLLRQDRILAGTFHPEIAGEDRLHRMFVALAA